MRIFTTINSAVNSAKKFIQKNRIETFVILLLLVVTVFLRFYQLGYSNFYGDESKTLYWNKTVSAKEFLLNQRKGPVQFLVAWSMEKASGGFDEATIRFPFALASLTSVFIMYIFLRRRYGYEVAFFGSFAFSILGFYIAFGRTVQYQSFLILFGLLSLLFTDIALEKKKAEAKVQHPWLALAGVFLGLSFLSHYDAVFFAAPIAFLLLSNYKFNLKKLAPFVVPFLLLVSIFYVPYAVGGYMEEEVGGYLYRRFTGSELNKHSSFYTFLTYSPSVAWAVVFIFSAWGFIKANANDKKFYLIWFLVPFVLFELVFSRPGTHIHNYIIPLLILFGMSVTAKKWLKYLFSIVLAVALFANIMIFIPKFNNGYPWVGLFPLKGGYQIFIYGFPYNRGWDEISDYLFERGVRSFYTNDNVTIGEWYLLGVPADANRPHYFVSVNDNQEFSRAYSDEKIDYVKISGSFESHRDYELVKKIFVEGEETANIYKRIGGKK